MNHRVFATQSYRSELDCTRYQFIPLANLVRGFVTHRNEFAGKPYGWSDPGLRQGILPGVNSCANVNLVRVTFVGSWER